MEEEVYPTMQEGFRLPQVDLLPLLAQDEQVDLVDVLSSRAAAEEDDDRIPIGLVEEGQQRLVDALQEVMALGQLEGPRAGRGVEMRPAELPVPDKTLPLQRGEACRRRRWRHPPYFREFPDAEFSSRFVEKVPHCSE